MLLGLAVLFALAVDPAAPARISYSPHHCFGPCPTYSVLVGADGEGIFFGAAHTAVAGERRFRVTGEQFRAFAARLAPLADVADCRHFLGESAPVTIRWFGADGSQRRNSLHLICLRLRHPAEAERLRTAPELLPIGDFIGLRR